MRRLILFLVAVTLTMKANATLVWCHVISPPESVSFRCKVLWGGNPDTETFPSFAWSAVMATPPGGGTYDFQQNTGSSTDTSGFEVWLYPQNLKVGVMMKLSNGWTTSIVPAPRCLEGNIKNETSFSQLYRVLRSGVELTTAMLESGESTHFKFCDDDHTAVYTFTRTSPGHFQPEYTRTVLPDDPEWSSPFDWKDTERQNGDTWSSDGTNAWNQLNLPPVDSSQGPWAQDKTLGAVGSALYQVSSAGFQRLSDQLQGSSDGSSGIQSAVTTGFVNMGGKLTSIENATVAASSHAADAAVATQALAARQLAMSSDVAAVKSAVDAGALSTVSKLADVLGAVNSGATKVSDSVDAFKSDFKTWAQTDFATQTNILGAIARGMGGVTNSIAGIKASVDVETNISGQVFFVQTFTTNLLGQIKGGIDAGTNISGEISRGIKAMTNVTDMTKLNQAAGKVLGEGAEDDASKLVRLTGIAHGAATPGLTALEGIWLPTDAPPASYPVESNPWEIQLCGVTMDFNPLHIPGMAELAFWVRSFLTWILTVLFAMWAWDYSMKVFDSAWQTPQARSSSNIPIASSLTAEVMAGAIAAVMATGPVVMAAWWTTWGIPGALGGDPMALAKGGSAFMQLALGLLNAFVPCQFTFGTVTWGFTFRAVMAFWSWWARTFTKLAVG